MRRTRTLTPGIEVLWAQGHGIGVRSWSYYGVGKVHIVRDGGWLTVCGYAIPPDDRLLTPSVDDARCKRCAGMSP